MGESVCPRHFHQLMPAGTAGMSRIGRGGSDRPVQGRALSGTQEQQPTNDMRKRTMERAL